MEKGKTAQDFYSSISSKYDKIVAKGHISSIIRGYIQSKLSDISGKRVLDIGCGTGTDAVYLAKKGAFVTAIDPSASMLQLAREKSEADKLNDMIEFFQLSGSEINMLEGKQFDYAYSDLDALNYIENLEEFSVRLAVLLKQNAGVYFVMLNKSCLAEWFFYMISFRPALAFKKLFNRAGTLEQKLNLYFPGKVKKIFAKDFNCRSISGFGIFLPPDSFSGFYRRLRPLFIIAEKAEKFISACFLFYIFCDHYIIELERK